MTLLRMHRRFDNKELGSANAGVSLKYLIVREQKKGRTHDGSFILSFLTPLKKAPPHSVVSECGETFLCMRSSPLHVSHIDVAAEEGCSAGNRRADVADVSEVAVPRREPADVRSAANAEVEDARVDRRRNG